MEGDRVLLHMITPVVLVGPSPSLEEERVLLHRMRAYNDTTGEGTRVFFLGLMAVVCNPHYTMVSVGDAPPTVTLDLLGRMRREGEE